jgi:hypothetical protein
MNIHVAHYLMFPMLTYLERLGSQFSPELCLQAIRFLLSLVDVIKLFLLYHQIILGSKQFKQF